MLRADDRGQARKTRTGADKGGLEGDWPAIGTPLSVEGDARPKQTSVRFSLEKGVRHGVGASDKSRGGLLTMPSSMSKFWDETTTQAMPTAKK